MVIFISFIKNWQFLCCREICSRNSAKYSIFLEKGINKISYFLLTVFHPLYPIVYGVLIWNFTYFFIIGLLICICILRNNIVSLYNVCILTLNLPLVILILGIYLEEALTWLFFHYVKVILEALSSYCYDRHNQYKHSHSRCSDWGNSISI